MKKKLFIFSNESIFLKDHKFFCDNIDLKSTPEGLNKKFEVNLFGRRSSKKRVHEILSAAKQNNCSIRIGVNSGSLEKDILEKYKEPCPEALVESALRNIEILEDQDFYNF